MHRWVGRVSWIALAVGFVAVSFGTGGCTPSGVGDPCTPEEIPSGGFEETEAYLETSSVQCRSRVCLVFKLSGDPTKIISDDPMENTCQGNDPTCVRQEEVDNRVYCSCRCNAPEGSNTPTCSCPDGFRCAEILDIGGEGIEGSYCVSLEALCADDSDAVTTEDCEGVGA